MKTVSETDRVSGWRVSLTEDGDRHVTPIGDLREHTETRDCWCHPTDDEGVAVHHSMDRREMVETGAVRPV